MLRREHYLLKPPSAAALSACTSRWCMTRRCSILPVFINGGRGALWNICPKASTGFSACACSTSRPAAASKPLSKAHKTLPGSQQVLRDWAEHHPPCLHRWQPLVTCIVWLDALTQLSACAC